MKVNDAGELSSKSINLSSLCALPNKQLDMNCANCLICGRYFLGDLTESRYSHARDRSSSHSPPRACSRIAVFLRLRDMTASDAIDSNLNGLDALETQAGRDSADSKPSSVGNATAQPYHGKWKHRHGKRMKLSGIYRNWHYLKHQVMRVRLKGIFPFPLAESWLNSGEYIGNFHRPRRRITISEIQSQIT